MASGGDSLDSFLETTIITSSPIRAIAEDDSSSQRLTSPVEEAVARRQQGPVLAGMLASAGIEQDGTSVPDLPLGPSVPAKRRQGQMQYVESQASAKKLKPDSKHELASFIQAKESEREVIMMALMLQMRDLLSAFALALEAQWVVPLGVVKNLNKYAIRILLSPNVAQYDNDYLTNVLMAIAERKLWGLSPTLREDDDGKWEKVESKARGFLVQRKSELKKLLNSSMNPEARTGRKKGDNSQWHIVQLCDNLTSIGIKSVKTNLVVTKAMCARMAFLRNVLRDYPNSGAYWTHVDHGLDKFRRRETDPQKRSKLFAAVLTRDLTQYKGANMNHLEKAVASATQQDLADIIATENFARIQPEEADVDN